MYSFLFSLLCRLLQQPVHLLLYILVGLVILLIHSACVEHCLVHRFSFGKVVMPHFKVTLKIPPNGAALYESFAFPT